MNGNIEGVTSPIGIGPIQGTLFWQVYFEKVKGFFIFVLIITGLAILLQIPNGIKYIFSKINLNLNPNFSNKLNTIKTTMGLTFVIITIIWFVLVKPVLDSRNETSKNLIKAIPETSVFKTEQINTADAKSRVAD